MADIGKMAIGVSINTRDAQRGFDQIARGVQGTTQQIMRQAQQASQALGRIQSQPIDVQARVRVDTSALKGIQAQPLSVPVRLQPEPGAAGRPRDAQGRFAGGAFASAVGGAIGTRAGVGAGIGPAAAGLERSITPLKDAGAAFKDAAGKIKDAGAIQKQAAETMKGAAAAAKTSPAAVAAKPAAATAVMAAQIPVASVAQIPVAQLASAAPPATGPDFSKLSAPVPKTVTLKRSPHEVDPGLAEAARKQSEKAQGKTAIAETKRAEANAAAERHETAKLALKQARGERVAASRASKLPSPLPVDLPAWDRKVVDAQIAAAAAKAERTKAMRRANTAGKTAAKEAGKAEQAMRATMRNAPVEKVAFGAGVIGGAQSAAMKVPPGRKVITEEERIRQNAEALMRQTEAKVQSQMRAQQEARFRAARRAKEAKAYQANWGGPAQPLSEATKAKFGLGQRGTTVPPGGSGTFDRAASGGRPTSRFSLAGLFARKPPADLAAGQEGPAGKSMLGRAGGAFVSAGMLAGKAFAGAYLLYTKLRIQAGWWLIKNTVGTLASATARTIWRGVKWAPFIIGGGGIALFRSGVKDILDADSQARHLGMTINDLRASMLRAGPASEAMKQGLGALAEQSALLSRGDLDATRLFAGMGLEPAFAQVGLADQFDVAASRIQAIRDPMAQAVTASRMFGAAWVDLLPEIQRGAAGMDQARETARRFGLAVTPADLENTRQVARVMHDLGSIWQGLKTQFTLGIAPIVTEIAKAFDFASIDLSGFRFKVINVAEKIAQAGALVIDAWSNTEMMKKGWGLAFEYISAKSRKAIGEMIEEAGEAMGGFMGRRMERGGQAMEQRAWNDLLALEPRIDTFWREAQQNPAMKAVNAAFDRVRQSMQPGAFETAAQAGQGFLKGVGLDGAQRGSLLSGLKGLFPSLGAPVKPAEAEQVKQAFLQMSQAVRSPLEAFRSSLHDVQSFGTLKEMEGPAGAALRGQFGFKAYSDLMSAAGMNQPVQLAGAAERGSKEAYSTIAQFEATAGRGGVQERTLQAIEELKRLQEEQARIGREMLDAMKRAPLEVVMKG